MDNESVQWAEPQCQDEGLGLSSKVMGSHGGYVSRSRSRSGANEKQE